MLFSSTLDRVQQSFPRQLAIYRLRTRILHSYADAAWPVTERYSGCNFVYVLTARSTGSRKGFFKVDIANAKALHSLG